MGGVETKEENYLKKCLSHIWDDLPFLLFGNAVFLLFCVPSFGFLLVGNVLLSLWVGCFTVAPAFSGLMGFTIGILQNRKPNIRDFVIAICRLYGRSVILGGLGALSLSWLLSILSRVVEWPDLVTVCLLVSSLVVFLFTVSLLVYAFPIMTLQDLPLAKILVQALFFASRYRIPTAGLVSLGILFAFLTLWSRMSLLIILPSVWAVFSCELATRLLRGDWSEEGDHSTE